MENNGKSRSRSISTHSVNFFTKLQTQFNGEKNVYLFNGAGQIGYLHAQKKLILTKFKNLTNNELKMDHSRKCKMKKKNPT